MVHVPETVVRIVRVLEVEVVVAGLNLVDGDAPGLLVFLAIVPPRSFRLELLDADRFAFVVALGAGRIRVLVVPDVGGRLAGVEEEQVGADAGRD
jgi:hypothetical protein